MTVTRMVAVVLGGGAGTPFGATVPKQLLTLDGRMLVEHCVTAFAAAPGVDDVLVVMPPGCAEKDLELDANVVSAVIPGGMTRSDSVRSVLAHLAAAHSPETTGVLLHDAARPLVSQQIIADCVAALGKYDAAAVAVAASDTVVIAQDGIVSHVPRRDILLRCQTPQCFRLPVIARAYELAAADPGFRPTDDCSVVLRYLPEVAVHVIPGSERNIKMTWPGDVVIAEALLRSVG